MPRQIAIVGDHFMRSAFFQAALLENCGAGLAIRSLDPPWPDVPMCNGAPGSPLSGLREYLGDPAAIVDFVGGAEILVTHLAPLSDAMLAALPQLRLVAVSRGGPRSGPVSSACSVSSAAASS